MSSTLPQAPLLPSPPMEPPSLQFQPALKVLPPPPGAAPTLVLQQVLPPPPVEAAPKLLGLQNLVLPPPPTSDATDALPSAVLSVPSASAPVTPRDSYLHSTPNSPAGLLPPLPPPPSPMSTMLPGSMPPSPIGPPPGLCLEAPCLPSIGSIEHGTGRCKPCGWFWKAGGCANGRECCHCHLCPEGEIRARRKTKLALIRSVKGGDNKALAMAVADESGSSEAVKDTQLPNLLGRRRPTPLDACELMEKPESSKIHVLKLCNRV